MMIVSSPSKSLKKKQSQENTSPEKRKRPKPPPAPFFGARKNVAAAENPIPSSSPAFATPAHPLRPFQPPAPAKAAILPIILPPPTLRPLAFRTFTKKHNLTLTSSALQELASFIGRHCGSGWREEGLAEKVLEEVARGWKNRNGGVIVDGASPELKDILKNLEGNMSGGRIITGGNGQRGGLSRQNSLMLEASDEADHSKTRLGLRPTSLAREDSQASFGMSGIGLGGEDDELDEDGSKDARRWLKVVSAFEQPRFTYNVAKKHFERITTPPSLLPPPSHKTDSFRNRYHIIHQRLLRNESFQTSAVTSFSRSSSNASFRSHKITPIANLLGRHGTTHLLLGMLIVLPTGALAISDLTGAITLDLSHAAAIPHDSAWFTPGMIVLVDGIYEEEEESVGKGLSGSSGVGGTIGGRFQGFFIGQPPCEKRRATLGVSGLDGMAGDEEHTIGGGFGWIDFLGVGSERAIGSKMRKLEQRLLRQQPAGQQRSRIVILGELNLDQPRSLQALKKVLSLYATDGEGETPMSFIITGNFTSCGVMASHGGGATTGTGGAGSIEYKEYFDALASTLADFPTLLTTATFVFVPGDNDGWVSAFGGGAAVPLPRRGVPGLFTSRVRRTFAAANQEAGLTGEKKGGEAVWTSNPSRLSLFGPGREVVVFRDDISARLRRANVRLKGKEAEGDGDVEMAGATQDNGDAMEVDGDEQQQEQRPSPVADPNAVPYDVLAARKLVKTILDQGYLAPFRQSIRPVHWDYTSPLYLYPLPTAVVLVDTTAPPFCVTYEGCHVMNPSSILVSGKKGVARWIEYEAGRTGKVRECTF
ncbi:uncharacterized protein PODANS_2_540 [Podospora anserina S mat+]|uniref:DNA polymerase epsilon subunit B n=1 Tax=Podospora anserina (strain S / ATCC MYA-4624 / DSM 980 / FGSC 10383) TaxID=515849 RepID=B2B498_PODAN|nr:uncharacterized protein PODANS_2_540 [Podospora anserina S mat+]CAP72622.1 unnamed protein product [Podospora anserina S mat+]CDP25017.1 Putative DNA polymerase epsilon subunit B [Podospora anserina S mat+]